MSYAILRQFWVLVEEIQINILLELTDTELVNYLLDQFEGVKSLNARESNALNEYIRSKISLIRDLADARLVKA